MSAARPDTRDFVDRLVIKALGAPDLPMPRLPSLFEGPQTFSGSDTDLVEADDETSAPRPAATGSPVRVARSPLPASSPRAPAPDTSVVRAQADEQDRTVRGAALPIDGQPSTRRRADEADKYHVSRIATARPARPGAARVDTIIPNPQQPNAKQDTAAPRDDSARAPSVDERHVAAHHRSVDHSESGPSADERSHGVLVPRVTSVAPSPERILTGQPRRAAAPELDAEDRRASPDIAVNVTIGRIEVKATRTDGPERKHAQPRGPQPMALDEYLGQRGAR